VNEDVTDTTAFGVGLYDNDDALTARAELLARVALPSDPPLFAACIGLLALLEPHATQLDRITEHPALASLPQGLREAASVAALVDASGPRLPYDMRVRDILGIDGSFGRIVEPLLELRESIMIARALREQCMRVIGEGFAYGQTAVGGPVGLLLELRELGVATQPDLVDEWLASFDRLRAGSTGDGVNATVMSEWSRAYRAALELLAEEPEHKMLGSDPSTARRSKRAR
jgi:hypothetical protein